MKKHINEVSSAGISASTDTEPDFGNFLAAGKIRKLGAEMTGKSDAWFQNGGYTQTKFPQADDMWGGAFDDLTVFNLDPGIYRKSSQELMKVPKTWQSFATPDDVKSLETPHSVTADGEGDTTEEFEDIDIKVPNYKDFF